MAVNATVDSKSEKITLDFGNDGAPDTLGPVTFVSSDPSVANVAADWDALSNTITPTGVGRVTLTLNRLHHLNGTQVENADVDAIELDIDVNAPVGERVKPASGDAKTGAPGPDASVVPGAPSAVTPAAPVTSATGSPAPGTPPPPGKK